MGSERLTGSLPSMLTLTNLRATAYAFLSEPYKREDYDRKRLTGPQPRPPRIVLRSGRDVAGGVAKDLEQACDSIGQAARDLWSSLLSGPSMVASGKKPPEHSEAPSQPRRQSRPRPPVVRSTVKAGLGGAAEVAGRSSATMMS